MTTKTKVGHTAGPWRTGDMFNTIFGPPNGKPCPEVIATIRRGANARLIASAPELLEALRGVLDQFYMLADPDTVECIDTGTGPHWYHRGKAAIAKAMGGDK